MQVEAPSLCCIAAICLTEHVRCDIVLHQAGAGDNIKRTIGPVPPATVNSSISAHVTRAVCSTINALGRESKNVRDVGRRNAQDVRVIA